MTGPSEFLEHRRVVAFLAGLKRDGKVQEFHHSPNGTYTPSVAARRKNQLLAVSPGFPDLLVLLKSRVIALELKKKVGGRVSDVQKRWLQLLESVGVSAKVCRGYDEAKAFIEEELSKCP